MKEEILTIIVVLVAVCCLIIVPPQKTEQITDKLSIIEQDSVYIATTCNNIYYMDKETFDKIEIGKSYKIKAKIMELK